MNQWLRGEIVGGPHCGDIIEIDIENSPLEDGSIVIQKPSPRRVGVIFDKAWIAFIDRGPFEVETR